MNGVNTLKQLGHRSKDNFFTIVILSLFPVTAFTMDEVAAKCPSDRKNKRFYFWYDILINVNHKQPLYALTLN